MGIQDRDWYKESFNEKVERYGGDFSLDSKPKKEGRIKPAIGPSGASPQNPHAYPNASSTVVLREYFCQYCQKKVGVNLHNPSVWKTSKFTCPYCGKQNVMHGLGSLLAVAAGLAIFAFIAVPLVLIGYSQYFG